MNANRNYYQMQLESHPLAPGEVDISDKDLGRFRETVRRGHGRRGFDDDCHYVGEFKGGELHGKGTYTFNDGSAYEGDFENGWMHGKGVYKVPGGHTFTGEYKEGQREGQGVVQFSNGIHFEGEMRSSKMSGKGKFTFPNGDVYEGEFQDDLPHGEGVYRFKNGTIYKGGFSGGRMDGEGQFVFPGDAAYDHDEYLPPGLSIPEKLRIPEGSLEGHFVKGQFFKPSLLVREPAPDDTPEPVADGEEAVGGEAEGNMEGNATPVAPPSGGGGALPRPGSAKSVEGSVAGSTTGEGGAI